MAALTASSAPAQKQERQGLSLPPLSARKLQEREEMKKNPYWGFHAVP
jgi:hypothetical protein